MVGIEGTPKRLPEEKIQVKQGADNSMVLITSNRTEEVFSSAEDALGRKKDALIINNALLAVRGIVVAGIVGAIGMFVVAEPTANFKIASICLTLIAVGGTLLGVTAPPNPKLIKRQIAEIKASMRKSASVK